MEYKIALLKEIVLGVKNSSFNFISFSYHKEGSPSANAGLQGAIHLLYNITIKNETNIYYH